MSGDNRPVGRGRKGAGPGPADDHLDTARAHGAPLPGRRPRWAARTGDPVGVAAVAGGRQACRHGICDCGASGQADSGRAGSRRPAGRQSRPTGSRRPAGRQSRSPTGSRRPAGRQSCPTAGAGNRTGAGFGPAGAYPSAARADIAQLPGWGCRRAVWAGHAAGITELAASRGLSHHGICDI